MNNAAAPSAASVSRSATPIFDALVAEIGSRLPDGTADAVGTAAASLADPGAPVVVDRSDDRGQGAR